MSEPISWEPRPADPPRANTVGAWPCMAVHPADHFICNGPADHQGNHVAYIPNGQIVKRWLLAEPSCSHDGAWVDHSHGGSFDWEYLVCACGAYALLDDDGLPGDWQAPDGTYKPVAVRDGI